MRMRGGGIFVSKLAMFVCRRRVVLGFVVLADRMVMRGLVMMMRRRVMVSRRLGMMFLRRMLWFLGHLKFLPV